MTQKPKRLPLPVRRQMNLTDGAYERLRELNDAYHLGNNYCLVVLLEKLDDLVSKDKLDAAYREFIDEYGAPSAKMP